MTPIKIENSSVNAFSNHKWWHTRKLLKFYLKVSNWFCTFFHPLLMVLKKLQHFLLIAPKHETSWLFCSHCLLPGSHCHYIGHKAQSSFYSLFFFFLKWRKSKECLRVLKIIRDKTKGANKIKYLGDFCMLKKNITRKLWKEESETKPLGAGLQWPLHKLLN